mgnify:CR=1 FL=1
MSRIYKPGDIIMLEGSGAFADGLQCEVLEVTPEGYIHKMRAMEPNPELARMGFFYEDGQYVIWEYVICPN